MTQPLVLILPWPPSANSYWRHPSSGPMAGRHLISEEGRAYRQSVLVAVLDQHQYRQRVTLTQRLDVTLDLSAPDRRRRDLDNCAKAILDALTHAKVYEDDSQIDALHLLRDDVMPPDGRVVVTIRTIDD